MEDQDVAPTDGATVAPFSELIRDWLNEGDRLDEKAAVTPHPIEGRVKRIVARLRPVVDRHRLFVLAGVGLIPLALFTLTHHGAPVPPVAVSTVSVLLPAAITPPATSPAVVEAPRIAARSLRRTGATTPSPAAADRAPRQRPSRHPHRHPVARRAR